MHQPSGPIVLLVEAGPAFAVQRAQPVLGLLLLPRKLLPRQLLLPRLFAQREAGSPRVAAEGALRVVAAAAAAAAVHVTLRAQAPLPLFALVDVHHLGGG